jgi:hypothetical protein
MTFAKYNNAGHIQIDFPTKIAFARDTKGASLQNTREPRNKKGTNRDTSRRRPLETAVVGEECN